MCTCICFDYTLFLLLLKFNFLQCLFLNKNINFKGGSTLTTGLLLCKTAICLISGHLSPMGVALDQQCVPLRFFKFWYLYPYLACHVTKTKRMPKSQTKYARYCRHGYAHSEPVFFTMLRMDFSSVCIFWELLHHKGSLWHIFLNSFNFV